MIQRLLIVALLALALVDVGADREDDRKAADVTTGAEA